MHPALSTERCVLHVDMDAFYASVEQRDDPSLLGKPVVVGGSSRRGVVTAASYEARPFGVHSAMPMMEALRKCPHAVVLPVRMARYAEVSRHVFEIFERFTPLVEGLSLDEAFLDVTASRSLFGSGEAIARQIKTAIRCELGLNASAGVAGCKFVAKVASDLRKPDAIVVVAPGTERAFLGPLPIERMWGVGPKTAPRLKDLGFRTLHDLANAALPTLEQLLGSWGVQVRALARGEDPRNVEPTREPRSIGAEQTYDENIVHRADVERTLLDHASRVAQRLLHEDLFARCAVVKLKYADFTVRSRRTLLDEPFQDTQTLYAAACRMLPRFERQNAPVRLTGVSATDLMPVRPLTLFSDPAAAKRRKLEAVISSVAERFEGAQLTRAELLTKSPR